MKIRIHLTPDGHQRVAKGLPVYAWDLVAQTSDPNDVFEEGGFINYSLLAEVPIQLPSKEAAVKVALTALKQKEQDINAQAYRDLQEVQTERANLLALTYQEPVAEAQQPVSEAEDDGPF